MTLPQAKRISTTAFVLCGVWLLLGLLVVPAVLESAIAGNSLPVLKKLLASTAGVSSEFLLQQWYQISYIGGAAILLLAGFAYVLKFPQAARRMVGEARPSDIGAIRVLVCAILLASTLWEDLASSAAVPRELIRPMGVIQLLYLLPIGFDRFAASPEALSIFKWFTALVLFLGMIGWRTRIALPIAAVCYLVLGGLLRHYAWFYHTGLVPWYLLVILALLPSHLGLSVDRRLAIASGKRVIADQPSPAFGWMRYAIWTGMALPYVMAGLSKIRNGGLDWWDAPYFKFILFQGALKPMHFDFDVSLLLTSAPDWVFEVLAFTAVAGEIAYGAVLFSRRARWIMPVSMFIMHIGILLLQNILFFDLIILQAIFFNWRPLLAKLGSLSPKQLTAPNELSTLTPERLRLGNAGLSLTLCCALAFSWVFRIEFYPLTGMQMFSKKRTQPVAYEVPLAHLRSGQTVRAPIEECLASMADSRYRRVLEMAFVPNGEDVTAKFFDACMRRWNSNSSEGDQITSIELQLWHWNFLSEPDRPPYGRMIDRKIFISSPQVSAASSSAR